MGSTAAYVRASTDKQVDDHQRTAIENWCDEHDVELGAEDWYVDVASGAKDDREQFQQLLDAIEAGDLDRVVVWEISRISRRGATLQQFFDSCEDSETAVVITDGTVDEVKPDGTGRFVADVIGMVYTEERRTLIRRIESGVERAQREGKWIGQVPAGFERDSDGFLQPNLDPDHDDDQIGYLELRRALERINDGESYRSVASDLPITRQGLSKIDQNEDRRAWYLDGTADNDRVSEALEEIHE